MQGDGGVEPDLGFIKPEAVLAQPDSSSMPEHPGGQVRAHRGPAQRPDLGGAHAGAGADIQADAETRAEEVALAASMPRTSKSNSPSPELIGCKRDLLDRAYGQCLPGLCGCLVHPATSLVGVNDT